MCLAIQKFASKHYFTVLLFNIYPPLKCFKIREKSVFHFLLSIYSKNTLNIKVGIDALMSHRSTKVKPKMLFFYVLDMLKIHKKWGRQLTYPQLGLVLLLLFWYYD